MDLPDVIVGGVQVESSIAGLLDLPVLVVVVEVQDIRNFPTILSNLLVFILPPVENGNIW